MSARTLEQILEMHDGWQGVKSAVEKDADSPDLRQKVRNYMINDLNMRGAEQTDYAGLPTDEDLISKPGTLFRAYAADGHRKNRQELASEVDSKLNKILSEIYPGALYELALNLTPYKEGSKQHIEKAEAHEKYIKASSTLKKASEGDGEALGTVSKDVEEILTSDGDRNPFGKTMYRAIANDPQRLLSIYQYVVHQRGEELMEKLKGNEAQYIYGNLSKASDAEKENFYVSLGREYVTRDITKGIKKAEATRAEAERKAKEAQRQAEAMKKAA